MKSLSIRTQVALMAAGLTALSVASIALTVIRNERVALAKESRNRNEALIQGINRIAAESLAGKDPLMLVSDLMFLKKEHRELGFWELTLNGHPYTSGLLASTVHGGRRGGVLEAIQGAPPDLASLPAGCAFAPRCRFAEPPCAAVAPPTVERDGGGMVRCLRAAVPA